MVKDSKRHHRTGLAVVDAVDKISNVVQIARDLCQLHGPRRIAERLENIARLLRHERHVREAVLRKAQRHKRRIRLPDIGVDLLVIFDLFVCHPAYLISQIFISCFILPPISVQIKCCAVKSA